MSIEAMKRALEAMKYADACLKKQLTTKTKHEYAQDLLMDAGVALRAAIETYEKQEPVAWAEEIITDLHALYDSEMITENDSGDALIRLDAAVCAVEEAEQRHTTPPAAQRQPLTKERIGQIIEQCKITLVNYCSGEKQTEFARAIEAAHGIKGEKPDAA
jgi:hypothetical protein